MGRMIFGTALIVLFLLFAATPLGQRNPVNLLIGAGVLLVPGAMLLGTGWRTRLKMPIKHPRAYLTLSVLGFGIPLAPLVVLIGISLVQNFREGLEFQALLRPVQEGRTTPTQIEPAVLAYLERTNDRQVVVVESLIKASIPGSEDLILAVMHKFGGHDREILEMLVNSGNPRLEQEARAMIASRGYKVETNPGSPRARWKGTSQ